MPGRLALLPLFLTALCAQPAWKEFSLGPAIRKPDARANNARQGLLHSNSISLHSLIAIAAGLPPVDVLGPEWLDGAHYAISAAISDESRLRLRTREPDETSVVDEFRSLLTAELVARFQLQFHRETRESLQYILQTAADQTLKARPSAVRERGRFQITGTPILNVHSSLDARGVTFRALANWLQGRLHGPMSLDASIPSGVYDFHLRWQTGDETSLVAALGDQLGLAVVKETRRREFLIVDHVERPDAPIAGSTLTAATANPAPDSSPNLAPAQLRRDLQVARAALEEGHPGIYRYTSKAELDQAFDRAAAELTRSMSAMEFYRVLAPAVAQLKCGHTTLQPSRAIERTIAAEPLFPADVAVLGGKVYLSRDLPDHRGLAGAEILSINGRALDGLLPSMLGIVHGDGDSPTAGPYQLSHDLGFARNLYLIAGLQSPFRVRYAAEGTIQEVVVNGMPRKAPPDTPAPPNASFRLLAGGSTGLLRIRAFLGSADDGTPLAAFFHRVFTELHEKHVPKLILDVRDNPGGVDSLGRELFAWFAGAPFRYYRDLIVNKPTFRFFREPLSREVRQMVRRGPDGKYHLIGHPNWGEQAPAVPHFDGKLVVLMNGGSFSTTCEFLAMLHSRGLATFVGEETAGAYYGNTSGTAVPLLLPNSKLILPVPLVGYYMAIPGKAQGAHGIRPDYPVEATVEDILAGRDRAMEVALRL